MSIYYLETEKFKNYKNSRIINFNRYINKYDMVIIESDLSTVSIE